MACERRGEMWETLFVRQNVFFLNKLSVVWASRTKKNKSFRRALKRTFKKRKKVVERHWKTISLEKNGIEMERNWDKTEI